MDFLVEENIVGLEYKFTKPFVYLNKPQDLRKKEHKEKMLPWLKKAKKKYYQRAREKKIPEDHIKNLWHSHIQQELASLKQFFKEQARRRGVHDNKRVEQLWLEYQNEFTKRLEEV